MEVNNTNEIIAEQVNDEYVYDNNGFVIGAKFKKPNDKVCKIAKWKPKASDMKVYQDRNLFCINFDKYFNAENIKNYNTFIIKKNSYENQLPVIVKYINYFMKFHDTENELLLAYLKLKYMIDKERRFTIDNYDQLISYIYKFMFTDTMVDKICDMVEDNYIDDIESETVETLNYNKKKKKHLESLEFKNIHIKILLRISFGMRCIAPVLFHFLAINNIKVDKNDDIIYNFYIKLFDIFSVKREGINIYNKLYVYVKTKVAEHQSYNTPIYKQREILGKDMNTNIDLFLRHTFISENIVKYTFPSTWNSLKGGYNESIIGLNKTLLRCQLFFFCKEKLARNHTEIVLDRDGDDGLSGMDKLEMNLEKIDEGKVVFNDVNISTQMDYIWKMYGENICDEEIDYFMENYKYDKLQMNLLYNYWAKYFGSAKTVAMLTKRDQTKLLIITKNILLYNNGCVDCKGAVDLQNYAPLAYILTGNKYGNTNNRIIKNEKYLITIGQSDIYKRLINEKYSELEKSKPGYIISIISPFINTKFTYVNYYNQELTGQPIEVNINKLTYDLLYIIDGC